MEPTTSHRRFGNKLAYVLKVVASVIARASLAESEEQARSAMSDLVSLGLVLRQWSEKLKSITSHEMGQEAFDALRAFDRDVWPHLDVELKRLKPITLENGLESLLPTSDDAIRL